MGVTKFIILILLTTTLFASVTFSAPSEQRPQSPHPLKNNGTDHEKEKKSTSTSSSISTTASTLSPVNSTEASNASSPYATIYTMSHFIGVHWSIDLSEGCTGVPGFMYRKASSIDTHDYCVILFAAENCTSRHVTIKPGSSGHSSLDDVEFDNTLVSLKPCNSNAPEGQGLDKLKPKENQDKVKEQEEHKISRNGAEKGKAVAVAASTSGGAKPTTKNEGEKGKSARRKRGADLGKSTLAPIPENSQEQEDRQKQDP